MIKDLADIQNLVIAMTNVKRNHLFPNTDQNENVVEHCFSVAMLCWKMHSKVKSTLDLQKIFKYALAHDFLERGLKTDTNTYATLAQREEKLLYEQAVLKELETEFHDFSEMTNCIKSYEMLDDEEARFVKTVDKIQAIILGELDDWRPYKKIGVTYEEFCEKGESFMSVCPDCLKETLQEVNDHSRKKFYDQPKQ